MKLRKLRKYFKYIYYRCVRIHGKPREVAMGMAIGLAVGMTPTLGFQMVIGVAIAALLGQSKIAAAVGAWITNPVTAVPIYAGTYALGAVVMGRPVVPEGGIQEWITNQPSASELLSSLLSDFAIPLWLGGFITAVPIAAVGYWGTYQAVVAYRLKVRSRRLNKLHIWRWDEERGWQKIPNPIHLNKESGDDIDEAR